MKIDTLQVVHTQSITLKSEENPLKEFKNRINPFPAMTCSRHVYIFASEYEYFAELDEFASSNAVNYQRLSGKAAYNFLLRWSVGAESHKLQSNDHFVLGQVRQSWDHFRFYNSPFNHDLLNIMPMLFEDASNIRRLIQDPRFAKQNVKDLLVLMCENCASSRQNEQKPAYESLLSDHEDYIDSACRAHLASRLTTVSKSMSVLNDKASIQLLPSMTTQMKVFRANLNAAFEKRNLQDAAEKLPDRKAPLL